MTAYIFFIRDFGITLGTTGKCSGCDALGFNFIQTYLCSPYVEINVSSCSAGPLENSMVKKRKCQRKLESIFSSQKLGEPPPRPVYSTYVMQSLVKCWKGRIDRETTSSNLSLPLFEDAPHHYGIVRDSILCTATHNYSCNNFCSELPWTWFWEVVMCISTSAGAQKDYICYLWTSYCNQKAIGK